MTDSETPETPDIVMAETEGDKQRKFWLELAKMAIPLILGLATGAKGVDTVKQKQVDRCEGALDTANGVVYKDQSPSYYEGFHEQLAVEVEKRQEAAEQD